MRISSVPDYSLQKDTTMAQTILIIVLILLLIGALPAWPYAANWGYYPSGGFGLVLLIVIIIALTSRRGP
jgi:hypothetical protein